MPASPEQPLRLVSEDADVTPAVAPAPDQPATLDELLRVDAWGRSEAVRALARTLYDPKAELDACGIGFVAVTDESQGEFPLRVVFAPEQAHA